MGSARKSMHVQEDDGFSISLSPISPVGEEDIVVERFQPTYRFWLVFTAISVLSLMTAIDSTSLSVALAIIAESLGGSAIEAFWAGTSFLLASTVFQPVVCSLSHIFGRRPMFYITLFLFLLGTLLAATANDFTMLLAGRAIQGMGGGGVITLVDIIITDLVPLRHRGKYVGMLASQYAVGSVLGPVIGGGFAQNVSWRWILWINLPFIVIGGILIWLFLQLFLPSSSFASKIRRIDFIGTMIFMGSVTSLLLGLSWGGVLYPWASVQTLAPLIFGVIGSGAFAVYEAYFASEPLLPPSLFRNSTANIAYLIDALLGIILWCLLYYLPLYFEAVKGYSPIIAGVGLFPETFTVAPFSIVAGVMVSHTGRYRWAILIGYGITTLGLLLNLFLEVDTSIAGWVFLTTVAGIGMGILFGSMEFAVQAASLDADQAYAASTFAFFRTFGQAIGVAIGGVVFQNRMKANLQGSLFYSDQAAELARDAVALVQVIKHTLDGEQKLELQTAYMKSLNTIFMVLAGFSFVAFMVSFYIRDYDMNRALEGQQGFLEEQEAKKRKQRF